MGEIGAGCLDEDEVLAFVAGDLPSRRREALIAHVDGCDTCRSLAAALAQEDSPLPDEVPASPRDTLIDGRFRLGAPLGKGAMGTVFRARDERIGTEVALKLLKREGATPSFARELLAGRRVTHPNVCRVHDAGSIDGYDYITMELIEGETLADLITREDLTPTRAHAVIDGIAAGLAAAHEQGIVHRDLKPANVMVERQTGRVVLTDFGVATDLAAGQSYRLVGTPQYWPPEQARGEAASPASDVYSLGVVAYRVLTGRDLKLSEESRLVDVPRALRSVIERCIEQRPSDRYKDAALARAAFASAARASERVIGGRGLALVAALAALGAVYLWPRTPTSPVAADTPKATATRGATDAPRPEPPRPSTSGLVSSAMASATAPKVPVASAPLRVVTPRAARPTASASAHAAPPTSAATTQSDILYVK